MLHESHSWKRELKKLKSQLVRLSEAALNEHVPEFNIERPILYSAIVVRRLVESWKVTDATRALKYSIETYPPRPERQGALMRLTMKGDIDVEFDLSKPQLGSMDAWEITSELLHSGFINWEVDEKSYFVGIYLASKRNQAIRLIHFQLTAYLQLLNSIIEDRVTGSRSLVDQKGRLTLEIW
jgi:hypothetical protein